MAVRYYFGNTVATVSPAFDASWAVTAGAARSVLLSAPTAVNSNVAQGFNVGVASRLTKQFISSPIPGNSIVSGTVKGQFLAREANGSLGAQAVIFAVSSDGLTNRGTILSADGSAISSEFTIGLPAVNRKFPRNWSGTGAPINTLVLQDNDRIVIEIGCINFNVGVTNTGTIAVASSAANVGDLPEDEISQSTTSNSWMEFSSIFDPKQSPAGHPAGAGVGLSKGDRWKRRKRTWTPYGY